MAKQNKIKRLYKKWLKRSKKLRYVLFAALGATVVLLYVVMNSSSFGVNAKSVRPLLDLIATAESNANYNAYFGNPASQSPKFTDMSVGEVQQWQAAYVAEGSPSSAVGRYQFLNSTLAGLVNEQKVDPKQKFDEKTQDKLAVELLERRGVVAYVNKQLTTEQFAANLAMEWASLPSVVGTNPTKSYYAGDGLNESRVSVDKVLKAVDAIQPKQ